MARWLIYRTEEGESYGQILAERRNGWTLVTQQGDTLEVDSVPRMQRVVSEDSLDLRFLREPERLRASYDQDPVGFIVEILRTSPLPKSAKDLIDHLGRYGIVPEEKGFKKVVSQLRRHANVEPEGSPQRFKWIPTPKASAAGDAVDDLLRKGLSGRASDAERRDIARSLAGAETPLDPFRVVLARALGSDIPAPDWTQVSLDGIDDDELALRVIDEAAAQRRWGFLAEVGLTHRSQALSKPALSQLQECDQYETYIASVLRRLAGELAESQGPEQVGRLVNRSVNRAVRLGSGRPGEPILLEIVGLMKAALRHPSTDPTSSVLPLVVRHIAELTADSESMLRLIGQAGLGVAELRSVGGTLQGLPLQGESKLRWLRAIAASGHADLLSSTDWWDGATIEDWAEIGEDPILSAVPVGHPELLRPAVNRALADGAPGVAKVLALDPKLVLLVDVESMARGIQRLSSDHPLQKVVAIRVAEALDVERSQWEERLYEQSTAAARRIAQLEDNIQQTSEQVAEERAHNTELRRRLRLLSEGVEQQRDSQLRQASIDGLRAAADLVSLVERSMASLSAGAFTLEELLEEILRDVRGAGVRRDAAVGEVITLDRTRYTLIDDDGELGGNARVVEAAYITGIGDQTIVLRAGKAARVGMASWESDR